MLPATRTTALCTGKHTWLSCTLRIWVEVGALFQPKWQTLLHACVLGVHLPRRVAGLLWSGFQSLNLDSGFITM